MPEIGIIYEDPELIFLIVQVNYILLSKASENIDHFVIFLLIIKNKLHSLHIRSRHTLQNTFSISSKVSSQKKQTI